MKPHEFRELVNELRDTAVKYHDHQSLRERIVHVLWSHEVFPDAQPAPSVPDGWKEAAIAWEVCASIHREYGKGKDPFFNTRQGDFVKHANDARAMLAAVPEAKP